MNRRTLVILVVCVSGVGAGVFAWWRASAGRAAAATPRTSVATDGDRSAKVTLTAQQERMLAKMEQLDPAHRVFCEHELSLGDRIPGEAELAPFLAEIRAGRAQLSEAEMLTKKVDLEVARVGRSLSWVADAWIRGGAIDSLSEEVVRHAVRLADHPDLFVRTSDAVLLLAIKADPGESAFPEVANEALATLLKHPYVGANAPRQYEARAAAAAGG